MRYTALQTLYEQTRAALKTLQHPSFGVPTIMAGSVLTWKDASGAVWSGVVEVADAADEGSAIMSFRDVKKRGRSLETTLEALRDGLDVAAGHERSYAVFMFAQPMRVARSLPQRMRIAAPRDFTLANVLYGDEHVLIFGEAVT